MQLRCSALCLLITQYDVSVLVLYFHTRIDCKIRLESVMDIFSHMADVNRIRTFNNFKERERERNSILASYVPCIQTCLCCNIDDKNNTKCGINRDALSDKKQFIFLISAFDI